MTTDEKRRAAELLDKAARYALRDPQEAHRLASELRAEAERLDRKAEAEA